MKNFSKEYVATYKDKKATFSIVKVAEDITPGNFEYTGCDGYGFFAISKAEDGTIGVVYQVKAGMKIVPLTELNDFFEKNIKPR